MESFREELNTNQVIKMNNSNEINQPQSYSKVAQSGPIKDQAIVIEANVGIPIKDYVYMH